MEFLQTIDPMSWIIFLAAAIVVGFVLFNQAITFILKLAVILVMLLLVVYFLVQAGVIELPIARN